MIVIDYITGAPFIFCQNILQVAFETPRYKIVLLLLLSPSQCTPMAIGLLESSYNEHPPGTVLLDDDSSLIQTSEAAVSRNLKHGTGYNKHIVLVSQPTDDPNDPLVSISIIS
jgi:hypothetical protein